MIIGKGQTIEEGRRQVLGYGLQLASQHDRVLYEDATVGQIRMGELLEGVTDDWMRAGLAMLLENYNNEVMNMSEATRLINVGDFQKYAYSMIAALFSSLAAHEFASVQPMAGPVSMVFYQKFIYNTTKGSAVAGQDIIENPNEAYASELIDVELLGTGNGSTANYTGSLSWAPVKPGTIEITTVSGAATLTVTDDGNGNLVGDVGSASTINYETGAYNVTFSGNVDAGEAINATYTYDSEANEAIPEIDMTLTSAPVTAIRRPLRTRWSIEAQQDLKNLHGLDAEMEQVAGITAELKYEIDREVIRDIKNVSLNSLASFDRTPVGISYTEHKLSFVDHLVEMSNEIFNSTQRAVGTWVDAGVTVCNLIETLPGFQSLPKPPNQRGVYKCGRLNNQWDIWKDPSYPGAARNLVDATKLLMGFKGTTMWEIGYIFSPYILAYTTPLVMLDDFIARKGIASRYGKKAVDGRFFCTSGVTGTP